MPSSVLRRIMSHRGGGLPEVPEFDLVEYPDEKIAFICGPQIVSGDASHPWTYFDTTATTRGIYHGSRFPSVPPIGIYAMRHPGHLTGTVTVTNGSAAVVGVGTQFLTEIDTVRTPPFFDKIGFVTALAGSTHRVDYSAFDFRTWKTILSVTNDTNLTLSEPYDGPTESGISLDTSYDTNENGANPFMNFEIYRQSNYYDQVQVQYINYYRTSDAQFLGYARKIADAWWAGPAFGSGTLPEGEGITPREASVGGMILRAMDGHSEMWDSINRYVRFQFTQWVMLRKDYPALYYGLRDSSYMTLYATQLAKCLPDSYPLDAGGTETGGAALRAQFLADVEDVAVNYYGRLQYPDGSFRWGDPDTGLLDGTTQVFHAGLLMHTLGDIYFLTANSSVKTSIRTTVAACVTHWHTLGPYEAGTSGVSNGLGGYHAWRGFQYFYHGGTMAPASPVDPTWWENGNTRRPDEAPNKGRDTPLDYYGAGTTLMIQESRALGQTLMHAYGLARYLTGDDTYKTQGDDVFDAMYGTIGDTPASDSIYANTAGDVKSYDESYRAGGRYLAFRVMTPEL